MKQSALRNLLLCLCLKARCRKVLAALLLLVGVLGSIAQSPLRVNVYDKFSRQPIAGSKVHLQDLNTRRDFNGTCNDEGYCTFDLPPAASYRLEVWAPTGIGDGYMGYSYVLTANEIKGKGSFSVELERVKRTEQGLLPAMYFESNQTTLSPDNQAALDNLLKMLAGFPSMQVQIGVYSDCREAVSLVSNRARAIQDYITTKNGSKQVTVKEFGNVRPLNACDCSSKNTGCTEEKFKENRRAEFKVVSF